jgi:hypothetical protein
MTARLPAWYAANNALRFCGRPNMLSSAIALSVAELSGLGMASVGRPV